MARISNRREARTGKQLTIIDDYGAVRSAVAVCALLDGMVALVRRVADVVWPSWSRRRCIATTLRFGLDVVDSVHHAALLFIA